MRNPEVSPFGGSFLPRRVETRRVVWPGFEYEFVYIAGFAAEGFVSLPVRFLAGFVAVVGFLASAASHKSGGSGAAVGAGWWRHRLYGLVTVGWMIWMLH